MAFWMTLGRSLFAMTLGVAIMFWPDKARPLLANFIGGFWIAGSLLTIRWGFAHEKSKLLTVLVGAVGAVAGLTLVGRSLIDNWVPEEGLFIFIGIVAILTGALHIDGRLQVRQFSRGGRTRSGLLLGIFEVVLGLIMVLTPWQDRQLINLAAVAWAMIGAVVLFADALAMRRQAKTEESAAERD